MSFWIQYESFLTTHALIHAFHVEVHVCCPPIHLDSLSFLLCNWRDFVFSDRKESVLFFHQNLILIFVGSRICKLCTIR